MPRPRITKATYTIMPDFGLSDYAWIKLPSDVPAGLGSDCADRYSWDGDHAISEELQQAFSAWTLEFDRAPRTAELYLDLDWADFHRRGLELARRLKSELGESVTVVYLKPSEDPCREVDERREVLADGRLLPLPTMREIYTIGFREMIDRIVSGGQTGADRAALDWAIANDMPHGGWCPKGRKAADGVLADKYQLTETESTGYRQRTKRNVDDSDGTLIVNLGELDGGTLATKVFAEKARKPCQIVQLDGGVTNTIIHEVLRWLRIHPIDVLNIAGPKEEKRPGIYALTYQLLERLVALSE